MKVIKIILALSLALALSSCAPVNVTTHKYILKDLPMCFPRKRVTTTPVLILFPKTNRIYNTRQIVYARCPYSIEYYTKNEWDATPAQMLYPLMVQSFHNSHYFRKVVTPTYYGCRYIILKTHILQFLQDFTCSPAVVKFTLRIELTNSFNDRVRTKLISIVEPICIMPPCGGIVAANRATERMLEIMINFTATAAKDFDRCE